MKKFVAPKQYTTQLSQQTSIPKTPTKNKNNISLLGDLIQLLPKLNLYNLFTTEQSSTPNNSPTANPIAPTLTTYNFRRTANILEKNRNKTHDLQNGSF